MDQRKMVRSMVLGVLLVSAREEENSKTSKSNTYILQLLTLLCLYFNSICSVINIDILLLPYQTTTKRKMKRFISLTVMSLCMMVCSMAQSKYPTADVEKHDVAILVIDMQNDFVDPKGVLCVAGAMPTVPAISDLVAYGREKNWKVIWVVREHAASGLDVDAPRIPLFTNGKSGYCVPGTWGCELVKGLEPKDGDIRLVKTRNSAFFNTPLDAILRRMGVSTVVLAGTQYPNCVRGAANDAMSYDYETVVCTDACSAKTPEVAEANVFDMRNMGIKCISLEEIKAAYK